MDHNSEGQSTLLRIMEVESAIVSQPNEDSMLPAVIENQDQQLEGKEIEINFDDDFDVVLPSTELSKGDNKVTEEIQNEKRHNVIIDDNIFKVASSNGAKKLIEKVESKPNNALPIIVKQWGGVPDLASQLLFKASQPAGQKKPLTLSQSQITKAASPLSSPQVNITLVSPKSLNIPVQIASSIAPIASTVPVVTDDDFDYSKPEEIVVPNPEIKQIEEFKIAEIKPQPEPGKPIEKVDFKKSLPSKDEMRRKNFIGDAVIAERADEHTDMDESFEQGNSESVAVVGSKPQRRSKVSMIGQLCDESLKDYKQQQKQLSIKKAEDQILKQAKSEMQKVSQLKMKLRQQALGAGVILNQLNSNLEEKLGKIKTLREKEQMKGKSQPEEQEENINFNEDEEEKTQLIKQIEVSLDSSASQIGAKKKKKKKKSQHQRPDSGEFKQILEEGPTHFDETIPPEPSIDWEALNHKRLKQRQPSSKLEEVKVSSNSEIVPYSTILSRFLNSYSHSELMEPKDIPNEDFSRLSFWDKLQQCFANPRLLNETLVQQRDQMMCLARVKLDFSDHQTGMLHEDLMRSIFMTIVPDRKAYRGVSGKQWEDIGFQGSDPRTDVRGAGILGVLHLLHFVESYPSTARAIVEFSNLSSDDVRTSRSFPFAIKCFEFTTLILKLLREGKLFSLCNKHNSVIQTCATLYCCLVLYFNHRYMTEGFTLMTMHELSSQIDLGVRKDGLIDKLMKEYGDVKDEKICKRFTLVLNTVRNPKVVGRNVREEEKKEEVVVKEERKVGRKEEKSAPQRQRKYESTSEAQEQKEVQKPQGDDDRFEFSQF
ncbi:hypothetical protein FGO68_gene6928 [Halteria grandinella]|uniref:ELMO domain-containing protein n=1 Tax=Halteria grandinella TaxID=5974 RepID=A0A8J8T5L6_HALGN|nr:hypothetical protein FGO68_gene6928 [Halteria grandinella]